MSLRGDLGSLGFLFEPFGPDAVRVTAALETAVDPEAAFLAALHALAGGEDLAKPWPARARQGSGRTCPEREWLPCSRNGPPASSRRRALQTENHSGLWLRAWLTESGAHEALRVEIR